MTAHGQARDLGARVSRRTLLGGALAAATVGSSCSEPAPPPTVATLTSSAPFYIAHRGGGGDWPEMTGYAYAQSAALPGLKAMEVSVCLSADGVLVCSHDPTTLRVTGVDYTIAEQSWATLATLKVTAAGTRDRSQPARPLTRLDDVAPTYIDRFVLFVEPKVEAAVEPLLTFLAGLQQPERVVWKQPVNSPMFAVAKQHGFATWGYVLNEPGHLGANLTQLAASASIDLLGASSAESDEFVQEVTRVATLNGKQSICWPITNRTERDRAFRLGCRGMMTSLIAELLGSAS